MAAGIRLLNESMRTYHARLKSEEAEQKVRERGTLIFQSLRMHPQTGFKSFAASMVVTRRHPNGKAAQFVSKVHFNHG